MNRSERTERALLVAILLVVGGLAGWASFSHMHDWTMANSPADTSHRYGWTNAVVSELVPVASLLMIKQRRRKGQSVTYPMVLLVGSGLLSLAAQLAVAKPGPSGWLLSAVPSVAFMALTKLVLGGKAKRPEPTPAPVKATVVKPERPAKPAVTAKPEPVKRVTPKSLTSAAKLDAALIELPEGSPAALAALAGVSESTARRYLKNRTPVMTSPSAASPAKTPVINGHKPQLVEVNAA